MYSQIVEDYKSLQFIYNCMNSDVKSLVRKSTQKISRFYDVLGLDLRKESVYFAPYENFYRKALDCSKDDIWVDPHSLIIKYGWMNLKPNIMLDSVSKKIRNNNINDAERQLNSVKSELAEWGEKWFLSAVYFLLEDRRQLKIAPFEVPDKDYLLHIWYMRNFFGMRKNELHGHEEKAKAFREKISDVNIADDYETFRLDYLNEFKRLDTEKENKYIEKKLKQLLRFPLSSLEHSAISLATLPLFVKDSISLNKLTAVCPFQRCRYYSEKISEMKDEELDDSLYSSSAFEKYSLPNLWLDLCTPSEKEKLGSISPNDDSAFNKLAKIYVPITAYDGDFISQPSTRNPP